MHIEQIAEKARIEEDKVVEYLYDIVTKGEVLNTTERIVYGRKTLTRIYYYNGVSYNVALGTNGFVVSAYPK